MPRPSRLERASGETPVFFSLIISLSSTSILVFLLSIIILALIIPAWCRPWGWWKRASYHMPEQRRGGGVLGSRSTHVAIFPVSMPGSASIDKPAHFFSGIAPEPLGFILSLGNRCLCCLPAQSFAGLLSVLGPFYFEKFYSVWSFYEPLMDRIAKKKSR